MAAEPNAGPRTKCPVRGMELTTYL